MRADFDYDVQDFDTARPLDDGGYAQDALPDGAAEWSGLDLGDGSPVFGLSFICPCGCKAINHLRIGPGAYLWDGDPLVPSLRPDVRTRCGWRGKLIAGEWRENAV